MSFARHDYKRLCADRIEALRQRLIENGEPETLTLMRTTESNRRELDTLLELDSHFTRVVRDSSTLEQSEEFWIAESVIDDPDVLTQAKVIKYGERLLAITERFEPQHLKRYWRLSVEPQTINF